jgi:competence protein ComEC
MKLPTVWITGAFASGIALAGIVPARMWYWVVLAAVGIVLGLFLLRGNRIAGAWVLSMLTWAAVGGAAVRIEQTSIPATHVTRLAAEGKLDLSEPLRWRGRLRSDSMRLPWGTRYEIDLESVESAGRDVQVSGGLRVNFYLDERHAELPADLRAGDRVEALVRAREPRNFLDPGAADTRGVLARQNINLIGSLRSTELLRKLDAPSLRFADRLARVRGRLLNQVNMLFPDSRDRTAVLRAMLLGDRNFVDSETAEVFQKTAVYHVLVLAGLHVAALAMFVFWLARRLRLTVIWTTAVTLVVLGAFLGVVQDRPPILRAALMAAIFLGARLLFRRMEMLNAVALAALILLIARPSALGDASFQLSFLAAGVIAGLAMPWIDRSSGPYREGLAHLGDVTRDVSYPARVVQFRLDLRTVSAWLATRLPAWLAPRADRLVTAPVAAGFRLWEVIVLSATIQLGLLPLLAEYFHRVSIYGPASNVPAVLLTGLIVPLGFLTLTTSFVWGAAARVLAKMLGSLVSGLLASVEWISHWPHASHRIPGPPVWLMILFLAVLALLAFFSRAGLAEDRLAHPKRPRPWGETIAGLALVVLALAVAIFPFAPRLAAGQLEVTVLDVGQGDSIFAAFPDGHTMLIDGGGQYSQNYAGGYRTGPDIGEEVVSAYLWRRGLKQVDVMALTHAHHDHLDGLYAVIDNFDVKELWVGRDVDSVPYSNLLAYARARGVTIVHHLRGDTFAWGGTNGHVLWPENPVVAPKATNDDCLVLRIEDGGIRFLLTGDIEKRVEGSLVKDGDTLTADFLKVPHHGSKTSSTDGFLSRVAPRVAVVSVGEGNPFGHPNPETLARLEGTNARLLRTDRDGAVEATTNGRELVVHTFVEMHPH